MDRIPEVKERESVPKQQPTAKPRQRWVAGEYLACMAVLVVTAAVVILAALIQVRWVRFLLITTVEIALIAALFWYFLARRRRQQQVAKILETEVVFEKYINSLSIPTAILDEYGVVCWQSPAFVALLGCEMEGKNAYRLLEGLSQPDKFKRLWLNGRAYKKEITQVTYQGKAFQVLRLVDAAKSIKTIGANKSMLSVICLIEIDNYKGLVRELPPQEVSYVDSQIDKLVAEFAAEQQGMLLKYSTSRYLVCFEYKYLQAIREGRFKLLDSVRAVETSNAQHPTLSIAVGAGRDPAQSGNFAFQAMELALGRGGDQAVVKNAEGYMFYGGIQRAVEERSRVRTRTVSKALRNLMEQSDAVYIMGHKTPDMDCLGAALGLLACARVLDKPCYIVLDKPNAAISALLDEMRTHNEYKEVIVSPSKAHLNMTARSMLIVVDTQLANHTLAPSLLADTKNLVVIDHHLKGTDAIENASLLYHEPYASSAVEMVTELAQYFSERVKLKPLEADAMLAGISIDTKGFSFKTGVRTFEAASYLRRAGANTTAVRQLFQDDMDTFLARAAVVRGAQVDHGIAIAVCPKDSPNPELLAAQAADSLLGIRGIKASFVLCQSGERVLISGRSLEKVNVQLILERLGGGGHAAIAGAQVRGRSIEEVREELIRIVREYNQQNGDK